MDNKNRDALRPVIYNVSTVSKPIDSDIKLYRTIQTAALSCNPNPKRLTHDQIFMDTGLFGCPAYRIRSGKRWDDNAGLGYA